MHKIFSVLSIVYFCLIYSPLAYSEHGSTYGECLRQAREDLKAKIQFNCAVSSDASGDKDQVAYQKCVEDGNNEQISDEANKKCFERAEAASGYAVPNQGDAIGSRQIDVTDGAGITGRVPMPKSRPNSKVSSSTAAPTGAKPKTGSTSTTDSANTSNRSNPSQGGQPWGSGYSQDLAAAEIEADRDIASCAAAMSTASECCNNPMACTDQLGSADSNSLGSLGNSLRNGPSAGGLTGYCQQMNTLGSDAGNVNTGLSGICYGSHSSCSDTCGGLARKYKSYLDICVGCEAQSLYQDTLRNLSNRQSSCDSLKGRSDQLAMTGLGTANNQALANYCSQLAGASTKAGSTGPMPKSDSAFINNMLAANCESDPNSPDCKGVLRGGKSGFGEERAAKDFNVPDVSGSPQGYAGNPATQASAPGTAVKVGSVANNSGGQIPGAGGTSEAKLPPRAGGPYTQAASATGGEEGGFRAGGGYTTQATAARDGDDESSAQRNIGGNGSQFESLDLRQFLPGGARSRRLAGLNEINAKEEDIFLRITNKMTEKCRLGILWQCR